ncbi:MAG: RidA family protein [Gammaproteobacteria bacterium]
MKNLFFAFLILLSYSSTSMAADSPDDRVKSLGLVIPEMASPAGNYLPYKISDHHIYISQVALKEGKILAPGALSSADDIKRGQEAARQTLLNILAVIKAACGGTLNCVEEVIRLDGYVASSNQFFDQAKVMNAASDLLVDVFGEKGLHARSAVGSIALPLNSAVEISAIIKLKDKK